MLYGNPVASRLSSSVAVSDTASATSLTVAPRPRSPPRAAPRGGGWGGRPWRGLGGGRGSPRAGGWPAAGAAPPAPRRSGECILAKSITRSLDNQPTLPEHDAHVATLDRRRGCGRRRGILRRSTCARRRGRQVRSARCPSRGDPP